MAVGLPKLKEFPLEFSGDKTLKRLDVEDSRELLKNEEEKLGTPQ